MIRTFEINNFKSIKHLKQDARRINVFIGEPNTGKSNILEALGMFSFGAYSGYADLAAFVRFERTTNLFLDENLHEKIQISFGDIALEIQFKNGSLEGRWEISRPMHFERRAGQVMEMRGGKLVEVAGLLQGNYDSLTMGVTTHAEELLQFKFYRFIVRSMFVRRESQFLLPPFGENLLTLLLANKELRSMANQLFSRFGFRLGLRPQESKIEVIKQLEDVIISYPYSLASDTLQRLVFYMTAVLSNRDSIIALEEPESHAFPYYTKYLAETIALDDRNNQFFITTHNPYFLLPLLEKCPKEDVAVFIVFFKDYQTSVKRLSNKEIEDITEIDIFSNLDRFLGE